MSPTDVKPSNRLLRAAQAEREEMTRQRQRLHGQREALLAELAKVDRAMAELDERESLLARLAGTEWPLVMVPVAMPEVPSHERGYAAGVRRLGELAPSAAGENAGQGGAPATTSTGVEILKGPAIRERAVELLVAAAGPEAIHYRDWYELLVGRGYEVKGKDPLAVFLTQVSRSPAVRKTTQAGVYSLDYEAPVRLRQELTRLQGELRELTSPGASADFAYVRARRGELTTSISQVERSLEEAERVLRRPGSEVISLAPRANAG